MTSITYLNTNFRFVFSPKNQILKIFNKNGNTIGYIESLQFYPKRFLIGAGQIGKYITDKNANKVILATEKMKTDKITLKFRKYGKIEIYVK